MKFVTLNNFFIFLDTVTKNKTMAKSITKKIFLSLDEKKYDIKGTNALHVKLKFPEEWKTMLTMKVGQSATFMADEASKIHSLRQAAERDHGLRFIIKKVDENIKRIWRVADNTPKMHAGRRDKKKKDDSNKSS